MTTGVISIGPKFFLRERRNYSNWMFAFWRELFQNSVDAQSKNIDIQINEENNEVVFSDDGCGMSSTIRDNVYFKLGETSKSSQNDVGGFGKARIVTCFSHESWSLTSQNWSVYGIGSEYTVSHENEWYNGLVVKVKLHLDSYETIKEIEKSLYNFLSQSYIKCNITSNIDYINNFSNWLYNGRKRQETEYWTIYTNNSADHLQQCFVRVSGVPMFYLYQPANTQIIVDLKPEYSRDILLSNRDSMNDGKRKELTEFLDNLNLNQRAVDKKKETIKFFGRLYTTSYVPDEIPDEPKTYRISAQSSPNITVETVKEKTYDMMHRYVGNLIFHKDNHAPCMVLMNEREDKIGQQGMTYFNPETWGEGSGKNRLALLSVWTDACVVALQYVLKVVGQQEKEWMPGFVFSTNIDACQGNNNNVNMLLLNPNDTHNPDSSKMKYQPHNQAHRRRLLMLAAHEASHIIYNYHNEDFANLNTRVCEEIMLNLKDIEKMMINNMNRIKEYFDRSVNGIMV